MIAELIRDAVKGCIVQEVRVGMVFGAVTAAAPLEIRVENRLVIEGDRLILPKELERKTVSVTFGQETQEIVLHPGLQEGDRVILIRMGEYFWVAGRLAAV